MVLWNDKWALSFSFPLKVVLGATRRTCQFLGIPLCIWVLTSSQCDRL